MTFYFDCIFYYVSDLERSIRFYQDVLGFKLVSQDVIARFDIDGVLFEIVPYNAKPKPPQGGNARLCLQVDSVEESLRELQSEGVHTGHAENKGAGVLGSFEDPDGNEICLWQYLPEKSSPANAGSSLTK